MPSSYAPQEGVGEFVFRDITTAENVLLHGSQSKRRPTLPNRS